MVLIEIAKLIFNKDLSFPLLVSSPLILVFNCDLRSLPTSLDDLSFTNMLNIFFFSYNNNTSNII